MLFLTAFITGLVSSLHCAGMCGPIAFALPKHTNSASHLWITRLMYNAGRIFIYALLGAIIGTLGFQLKLAGFQQSVSIFAGISILTITLLKLFLPKIANKMELNFWGNKWFGKLFRSKNNASFFLIGAFNGLLPCGFVYVSLIASLTMQSAFQGALFMVLFGLGTFPMMFAISMLGQIINLKFRQQVNRFVPVFAILFACFFILRGLHLGIPFISPQINNTDEIGNFCGVKQH
jgi:sulfite exporter TauE/SafE